MMKLSRYLTLLPIALIGALLHANDPASGDELLKALPTRSEWWPLQVRLTEAVTVDKGGQLARLSPGRQGILIRAEENGALLDLGGFGVHLIPYEDTDIPSRLEAISAEAGWERSGLLASQLGNKFFWPANHQQTTTRMVQGKDYFLLSYLNIGSPASTEATQTLVEVEPGLTEKYPQLTFWTIPLDSGRAEILKDLEATEINWPVMLPTLTQGYTQSLQHHPEDPTAVLIDKNGRILLRLEQAGMANPEVCGRSVSEAIDEDVARRQALDRQDETLRL
jgi:hypothetical protein